jgi:hypothetical protein
MHRSIEITVNATHTDTLIEELEKIEDVIGLSVLRGISVKPPGDVLTVHVLNRGSDEVWRRAQAVQAHTVTSSELISLVSPQEQKKVESDVDEAVWEEMDANLRHQGKITLNYLLLMALGGAVAAASFTAEPVNQAIMLVAASVIAPGFEPIAHIPFGIVLRHWRAVRRGIVSMVAGYLALVAGAAAAFGVLRMTGVDTVAKFLKSPEVRQIADPTATDMLVSACAALIGVVMLTAYRRHVIAGPLIVLKVIPAAAVIGAALATGQFQFIDQGLRRWALDVFFIVVLGVLFMLFKQATLHRRSVMA